MFVPSMADEGPPLSHPVFVPRTVSVPPKARHVGERRGAHVGQTPPAEPRRLATFSCAHTKRQAFLCAPRWLLSICVPRWVLSIGAKKFLEPGRCEVCFLLTQWGLTAELSSPLRLTYMPRNRCPDVPIACAQFGDDTWPSLGMITHQFMSGGASCIQPVMQLAPVSLTCPSSCSGSLNIFSAPFLPQSCSVTSVTSVISVLSSQTFSPTHPPLSRS